MVQTAGWAYVQITPLQDVGTEIAGGMGIYFGVGLYSEYYGTSSMDHKRKMTGGRIVIFYNDQYTNHQHQ